MKIIKLKQANELTQQLLKEYLTYDPASGLFYRNYSKANVKKGDVAGHSDPTRYGYIRIGVCGFYYQAHRLVWLYMTGSFPTKDIDHIDHDTSNNAWNNLREVTKQENGMNQRKYKSNSSSVSGVSFRKDTNNWRARIMHKGTSINLGSFASFEAAVETREKALKDLNFHQNHGKLLSNRK